MESGAWQARVHKVAKSWTQLKQFRTCTNNYYNMYVYQIRADQISRSVVSDSLQPHESQHASLPVHHQHPELTQTHVYQVGDAIQPSHPLSSPSPPAPNPSQHQSLFQ